MESAKCRIAYKTKTTAKAKELPSPIKSLIGEFIV